MEQRHLSLLPSELQAVVAEAEALAGCAIVVRREENARAFDNVTLSVSDAGVCTATIAHLGGEMSQWALVHEVLHIKRYWLVRIPHMFPAEDIGALYADAQLMEDMLEHLIIIPQEREYVPKESVEHWSRLCSGLVASLPKLSPSSSRAERVALKRSLFQLRAMADIALPTWDRSRLMQELKAAGSVTSSRTFVEQLRTRLPNKMSSLRFASTGFEFRREAFQILTDNLTAVPRRRDVEPL